jgi:hypothetical protein
MPVLASAKTMPTSPGIKSIEWTMSSVVGMVQSPFTLQQQTQEWPGQIWRAKVTLPVMTRANAATWMGFFGSLRGRANTFMLGPTPFKAPQGLAGGAPVVKGANNGGSTLSTSGWPINIANVLKAGDFFQLGNYLYMVVNPENSDLAGNANFDIWPNLRVTPGAGDALIVTNPQGIFRMATNDQAFSIDEALIYGMAFDCMEAI